MFDHTSWIRNKIRIAWITLVIGIIIGMAGLITEKMMAGSQYNFRILTGLGLLITAIGIGNLVRYRVAGKDPQSARRLTIEAKDERTVLIRSRAGNRAYWASAVMVYAGLMWSSLAANGSLPDLSGDILWYFLAAAVLIPFAVYITSIVVDQRNT